MCRVEIDMGDRFQLSGAMVGSARWAAGVCQSLLTERRLVGHGDATLRAVHPLKMLYVLGLLTPIFQQFSWGGCSAEENQRTLWEHMLRCYPRLLFFCDDLCRGRIPALVLVDTIATSTAAFSLLQLFELSKRTERDKREQSKRKEPEKPK